MNETKNTKNDDFEQKTRNFEQKIAFLTQKVEKLEQIRNLASEVREAQKEYFRTRSTEALKRSKALERRLDGMLAEGVSADASGAQISMFGEGGV